MKPVHIFKPCFCNLKFSISFHLGLDLPSGLLSSDFQTKYAVSSVQFVLHAPKISLFFICLSSKCLIKVTNYEAPHYAISSSFLLLLPKKEEVTEAELLSASEGLCSMCSHLHIWTWYNDSNFRDPKYDHNLL
jgi:hypothetical protein